MYVAVYVQNHLGIKIVIYTCLFSLVKKLVSTFIVFSFEGRGALNKLVAKRKKKKGETL
jgi:hypothetical protein